MRRVPTARNVSRKGLNKARNPDYFVRIRHSVSEMGDHLQPHGDPARRQREEEKGTKRKPAGRNKKKRYARLTYAFNDRLETSEPRSVCLSGASLFWQ